MKKILIINGPNINLVGQREPNIYGTAPIKSYLDTLKLSFKDSCFIEEVQSNHEGAIIDAIQEAESRGFDAVIINAGGYSHTSVAIRDAIASISEPVIEVHISNIFAREDFRKESMISPVCKGFIAGFGLKSYELAIRALI